MINQKEIPLLASAGSKRREVIMLSIHRGINIAGNMHVTKLNMNTVKTLKYWDRSTIAINVNPDHIVPPPPRGPF